VALVLGGTALVTVGACSRGDGAPGPAPSATVPACATALAAAPATVLGADRTPLDVAGTLSYGSPAVVVRCGVPALTPTSRDCLTVDGVDWVLTRDGDPLVFATYGRDPAVEVRVPAAAGRENAAAALVDVAAVARSLPANGRSCVG
jgi:hypothetical protein